jgi:hypothetical protein
MTTFSIKKSIAFRALTLLGLVLPSPCWAQSSDGWNDSRPFLVEAPAPMASQSFILAAPLYDAISRSLLNREQHVQLLDLQSRTGTRPLDTRLRSISVYKLSSQTTSARPTDVTRSMSTFFGREFKSTALPEALRRGISFNLGTSAAAREVAAPKALRYGLIVKNVEPSTESFRLAALPKSTIDEYAMVHYAPKATIHYEIGPLTDEQDLADSAIVLGETESSNWSKSLPEFQFRGRIAVRGAPTANQIMPPQSILLEQTQGFYALEVHTSHLVHKDAMFHRLRMPLLGSMNLRQERNEKFKNTRSTLENIYVNGPLALNLDYFGHEKRYQTGLIYQKSLTRIEFYNHLPENYSAQGGLWKTQRYELKVQKAF